MSCLQAAFQVVVQRSPFRRKASVSDLFRRNLNLSPVAALQVRRVAPKVGPVPGARPAFDRSSVHGVVVIREQHPALGASPGGAAERGRYGDVPQHHLHGQHGAPGHSGYICPFSFLLFFPFFGTRGPE